MFATSSLTKLLTDNSSLSPQLRLDMRNYVINYLATKGTSLESFVTTAQIQLLSRITKTGWLDSDDAHREVVKDIMNFLKQPSTTHYHVGLKIFNQLVTEMNQQTPGTSLISQRKIAVSFRHNALLNIFQISLQALQSLQADPASEPRLKEQATSLVLVSLSYDFVGTSLDESTEDIGTIQAGIRGRKELKTRHYELAVDCNPRVALENTSQAIRSIDEPIRDFYRIFNIKTR